MLRFLGGGLLATLVLCPETSASVTFYKHVFPVLQKQCQSCHRPGEVAPMSFLTYEETRPWAKAIKAAVLSRKMPPWSADPKYGHFRNERRLTDAEIQTLVTWADTGAIPGNQKDQPSPVRFPAGWTIGEPDFVVEYPNSVQLPASGTLDQANLVVKVNFPHDAWIQAAEIRPGNPRVVHHMKAWIRPPGSTWLQNAPPGELYVPKRN